MPLPASERLRWALLVAAAGLLLLSFDVWWIATHRHGYPLNIDEAAYATIGLTDYLGLRDGGLHSWWEAVQSQTPNAPLVPALASLLYLVKPGVLEGFGVLGAAMVLLGLAIYGIGERLAGPRLGALAGLAAMTAPGVLAFAHVYIFALPAAALLAGAVYALLRSEGLRRPRWALACGLALGLMLLARTMTVAFVPGVLAAAALALLVRRRDRGELVRGAVNLSLLVLAAVAVAALWYWRNLQPVLDYLTEFGYGGKSGEFGAEHPLVSWARWTTVGEEMTAADLLLPLAALVLAGLVAVAVGAIARVSRAGDRGAALLELARGDSTSVAVVVAAGYLALTSSRNTGFGFTLPLSVLLLPLAAIALRRFRAAAVPALAAVALIATLNLAASTDLWSGLSRDRRLAVPGLARLPWLSGVNYALADIRSQVAGPETRFAARDRGWPRADEALAALLLRQDGPPVVVAFASRSHVFNTNTVQLAGMVRFQRLIPMAQLLADRGDSAAAYARQMTDPRYGQPKVLITMSSEAGDYLPHVTQAHAEDAARHLGFRLVQTLTLPDGRLVRVWSQLT
jgi:4-amino-4-deoxy-L-arabinose transferase-like glycosyltransferase